MREFNADATRLISDEDGGLFSPVTGYVGEARDGQFRGFRACWFGEDYEKARKWLRQPENDERSR